MTLPDEQYFLSATNPVANVDQRDLEQLTMRLLQRDDVKAACRMAHEMWVRVCDKTIAAEQNPARMNESIGSYCVKATMVAALSDPNHPRIMRVYTQDAQWFGHHMPCSKWGGDNPNNAYRLMAVSNDGQYELQGRRAAKPSTYVTFQLVGNTTTSLTMGSLEQMDMDIAADGTFTLTLDATPPNGRRNHLQIPPGTLFLFVRDSMGDWNEDPNWLRIHRLNPPTRGPLSEDELAKMAVRNITSDVFYAYYASRLFHNWPQQMQPAVGSGNVGGLVTQVGSVGHFTIGDDEAVVITRNIAGAAYRDIVLHDELICSYDNRDHLSSYTNAQMKPDADGRVTYVLSLKDPGVHNWLDTAGFHDATILCRWQGLPKNGAEAPVISSRVVKLAELEDALPSGVAKVTPAEREAQLAHRRATYDRRFQVG